MDAAGKSSKLQIAPRSESSSATERGVLLLDSSLNFIALDKAADAMLTQIGGREMSPYLNPPVPDQILDAVRRCKLSDTRATTATFRIRNDEYTCRVYCVNSISNSLPPTLFVVQITKHLSEWEMLMHISRQYRLTDRELEALKGVATGLSGKELAAEMQISPNTVKSFLRLIMVKMGVSTRAGIVAKIRDNEQKDSR